MFQMRYCKWTLSNRKEGKSPLGGTRERGQVALFLPPPPLSLPPHPPPPPSSPLSLYYSHLISYLYLSSHLITNYSISLH